MNEQTRSPHEQPASAARHPVSIGHLVMGVALLGLVVIWALMTGDVVAGKDIRYLLPAPWIVAGVAGLVALIASDRRTLASRRAVQSEPPPPPTE